MFWWVGGGGMGQRCQISVSNIDMILLESEGKEES